MTVQANKDLDDLRSAFNEFEKAFQDWTENQSLEDYNRARSIFIKISNDYEHIKQKYEEKTAKVAQNIAVTYFSSILTNMLDAGISALLILWTHCSEEIDGHIFIPIVTAVRNLPAEKYQTFKKWEPILLASLKEPE
jgi:hypothetical protein